MTITRATLALPMAAAAALIAGCGGTTSTQAGSTSTSRPATAEPIASTADASPAPARGQSAHAQLVGFARAVDIRPEDVPGFRITPRTHARPHNKAFEDASAYARCFHVAKESKPLVKIASSKFKAGSDLHSQQVSSNVEVEPTLATARRELAEASEAIHRRSSTRCFARQFDALGTHNQPIHVGPATVRVTVGNLRLVPVAVSAATHGTDGGFGFSLSADVKYVAHARGRTFTHRTAIVVDSLGFLVGRAGVKLNTFALGSSFPPALEARLLSQLVARATAAGQAYPAVKR